MGHLVSYNIFDAALHNFWLRVILYSLRSQPVPLFMTPQVFLFLLLWSLLWRTAKHVANRYKRTYESKLIFTWPKCDINLTEKMNYSNVYTLFHGGEDLCQCTSGCAVSGWFSKWTGSPSESELFDPLVLWKQNFILFIFILYISHIAQMWFAFVFKTVILNSYITWFPGQTQRCYSQCPNPCPASLWPVCSTILPALSDSYWSEIKSTEETFTRSLFWGIKFPLSWSDIKTSSGGRSLCLSPWLDQGHSSPAECHKSKTQWTSGLEK